MGRIEKQKRELMEESNKRMLNKKKVILLPIKKFGNLNYYKVYMM